jgi:uncharacterized protein YjbJ (UPF0337 family)
MQNKNRKPIETFKITGNWEEQTKLLKEKYPKLTDADLKFDAGKEEELLKRLETRLGKKRDEIIGIITKGQLEKV